MIDQAKAVVQKTLDELYKSVKELEELYNQAPDSQKTAIALLGERQLEALRVFSRS